MPELIANTSLFVNDRRPVKEQLMTLAEIGAQSPEALTLAEIGIVCRALLRSASVSTGSDIASDI